MCRLAPAYSGSCALGSYYHSESQLLKVACTGNSGTVLGRYNAAGKREALALSSDQVGGLIFDVENKHTDSGTQRGPNKDEVAKLHKEHPDEYELVKDARVLGLAVTRAFGDGRWKWWRQIQKEAQRTFFGPRLREPLISPPYLIALPTVTTTKIEPENKDFLIMASSELWDHLISEQPVELVSQWLKTRHVTKLIPAPALTEASNAIPMDESSIRRNPEPKLAYTGIHTAD